MLWDIGLIVFFFCATAFNGWIGAQIENRYRPKPSAYWLFVLPVQVILSACFFCFLLTRK